MVQLKAAELLPAMARPLPLPEEGSEHLDLALVASEQLHVSMTFARLPLQHRVVAPLLCAAGRTKMKPLIRNGVIRRMAFAELTQLAE